MSIFRIRIIKYSDNYILEYFCKYLNELILQCAWMSINVFSLTFILNDYKKKLDISCLKVKLIFYLLNP